MRKKETSSKEERERTQLQKMKIETKVKYEGHSEIKNKYVIPKTEKRKKNFAPTKIKSKMQIFCRFH